MTTHKFVCQAAKLFNIQLVEFAPMPKKISSQWFQSIKAGSRADTEHQTVFYSPLNANENPVSSDQLLIESSHEVRVLHVRNSGNVYRALKGRLLDCPKPASTYLLRSDSVNKSRNPQKWLSELAHLGAVYWYLYFDQEDSGEDGASEALEASKENDNEPTLSLIHI